MEQRDDEQHRARARLGRSLAASEARARRSKAPRQNVGRHVTVGAERPLGRPRSAAGRSEEHTSELQSLMRISYAVFCLKKKKRHNATLTHALTTRQTTT